MTTYRSSIKIVMQLSNVFHNLCYQIFGQYRKTDCLCKLSNSLSVKLS